MAQRSRRRALLAVVAFAALGGGLLACTLFSPYTGSDGPEVVGEDAGESGARVEASVPLDAPSNGNDGGSTFGADGGADGGSADGSSPCRSLPVGGGQMLLCVDFDESADASVAATGATGYPQLDSLNFSPPHAAVFNGGGSLTYSPAEADAAATEFSLAFVVRYDIVDSGTSIGLLDVEFGGYVTLSIMGGIVTCGTGLGSAAFASGGAVGVWHRVSINFNGSVVKCVLDGLPLTLSRAATGEPQTITIGNLTVGSTAVIHFDDLVMTSP